MPSLHMSAAILAWWGSRRAPVVLRVLGWLFLFGTAFATLATGEHYMADLVVAFPFMMAVRAMWEGRRALAFEGVAMVVGWLVALRFASPAFALSPVLPWACAIVTVARCVAPAGLSLTQHAREAVAMARGMGSRAAGANAFSN